MSNYTKTTNFTAKDSLPTGNPSKLVKGSDFDTELSAIETAVNSKADSGGYNSTSTDSVAIGVGAKTLNTQTNKEYVVSEWVIAVDAANSANYMVGQVTSYSGGALAFTVPTGGTGGSGTISSWKIYLAYNPLSAIASATAAAASASAASTSASNASTSEINASSSASTATTQASNASGSATLASQWASLSTGQVASTDYSSKAYAIGGTGVTGAIGAAKEWATTLTTAVDGATEYSAKEYAIGDATASGGSAKAWAIDAASPDGTTTKSAKTWAGEAATSASNAAISETNAAAVITALTGTSTTSLTPSLASKVVTTQSDKDFQGYVTLVSASDTSVWMSGPVTSYVGTTLTFTPDSIGTATTKADWNVYGRVGAKGATGPAGAGDVVGPASAIDSAPVAFDGTTGKLVKQSGVITSIYGGTGNGFTKFSGPTTSEKTFTLPDANASLAILGANTFTGNQTLGGNKIIQALQETETSSRATIAISAGVLALDFKYGFIDVSLNAAITSITQANNLSTSAIGQATILTFTADGTARSVTWPAGDGTTTLKFNWPAGTAPTLTSTNGKRDRIGLIPVSAYLVDAFVIAQNL